MADTITDSTDSTDTDLTKLFDEPIAEDLATSFEEFSSEELLRTALMVEEITDDYERHVEPPGERFEQLDLLENVENVLRNEAENRRCASEADHIINAIEPVWLSVEHVFDPETGRPTEVAITNRELLESMYPDTAEYECSCGEELRSWSEVTAHLEKQAADDN